MNPHTTSGSTRASERLLLQVDGLGCLLLLQQDRVTIGGLDQSAMCDITLQTAGVDAPLVLDRDTDRYLARSDSAFSVSGKKVTSKLLLADDTLEIGSRGRLRFRKPVPASATAVLQPTAASFQRSDIRYAVLMNESLLFGPTGAHFPLSQCRQPLILARSDDQFSLRVLTRDGKSATAPKEAATLSLNQPAIFDDIQFVLQRYEEPSKDVSHVKI